jgi:putative ABC transport system ATP-binding protein
MGGAVVTGIDVNNGHSSERTVVLSARGLNKSYQTGEIEMWALRGVDLELRESELVVLLGPSVSGKSTLLNILVGLDRQTAGEVRFRGNELPATDDRALTRFRRDHVGFVFQFYNLIPSLIALENVALVIEIAPSPLPPADALALVRLNERIDHFTAQLSGGEQQRVAIARAIAKRPDILLCDEPTGTLDSATGIVVLEAIEQVNRELGTTTALITHNTGIGGMADRVISFRDGRIVSTVNNAYRHARARRGAPPVQDPIGRSHDGARGHCDAAVRVGGGQRPTGVAERNAGIACNCARITITAPVSGQILRRLHESEVVVQAGEPLIEIGNPQSLEIVADLLSSDAVKVEVGQ